MKYRLSFNGGLNERSANALRDRIAGILERADIEPPLVVMFSSGGGSTIEGLSLYDFIRSSPSPLHLHAVGHVGSMAVPVFLGAHKRSCTPITRFFFHSYDWVFDGRKTLDGIDEAKTQLTNDSALSRQIVEARTRIPADRLNVLYGNSPIPTIISAEEAVGFGIVDEIIELNPTGAPQPGVAVWTVNWAP